MKNFIAYIKFGDKREMRPFTGNLVAGWAEIKPLVLNV